MKTFKIDITKSFEITSENIEDLLVTFIFDGVGDWCEKITVCTLPDTACLVKSEVITHAGELLFHTQDGRNTLNIRNFLEGIKLEILASGWLSIEELMDSHDANIADNILQYALFGELIYG